MLYVIFVSISTKADMIVNNLSIIWTALIVILAFIVQQQGIVNYAKIAMPRWFQLKN